MYLFNYVKSTHEEADKIMRKHGVRNTDVQENETEEEESE